MRDVDHVKSVGTAKGLQLQVTRPRGLHEPPLQNPEFLGQVAGEVLRQMLAELNFSMFEKYPGWPLYQYCSISGAQGALQRAPTQPTSKARRTSLVQVPIGDSSNK
jgi:hypothetical protein